MRIAINCRSILLTQRTGIGRYTYHLLDTLGKIDRANVYLLHSPKGLFDFRRRLPEFEGRNNLKRYPDYFRQGVGDCDIYHFPCPDAVEAVDRRMVVTIHDMIYKSHPQTHTAQTVELTDKFMQAIRCRADRIICTSYNTRQDLHRFLDIPLQKTSVVYSGVDPQLFYPLSPQDRFEARLKVKALGIDRPFILFVGTIEPRKNLNNLLESFTRLKFREGFRGQLVVVGMQGWMMDKVREKVSALGIGDDVVWTGFVTDTQLCRLYNLAEVFVFPSLYEGFGFPILEAFCCGTPVITSATSSCAEIAGSAALTIDPQDVHAMTCAIAQILDDPTLNLSLRRAALKRGREFSFERMARETLNVYQRLAAS